MHNNQKTRLQIEELENRASPACISLLDSSLMTLRSPSNLSDSFKAEDVTKYSTSYADDALNKEMFDFKNKCNLGSVVFSLNAFSPVNTTLNNTIETNKDLILLEQVLQLKSAMSGSSNNETSLGRGVYPGPSRPHITVYAGSSALNEDDEQGAGKPGWYLPVNWGDVDGDQWDLTVEPPSPTSETGPPQIGDKDDDYIPGPVGSYSGGSPYLFRFEVTASLIPLNVNKDGNVKLTFDTSKIRVWKSPTKKDGGQTGASTEVTSGTVFNWLNDMAPNGGKVTLYAEGIQGSSSFKDAFLKADLINVVAAQPPGAPDEVQVTTFEIASSGMFSGPKSTDNEYSFIIGQSSNNTLGINDYSIDAVCKYFRNCMEMQGTVTPPVVMNEVYPYAFQQPPQLGLNIVTFDAARHVYGADWGLKIATGEWEMLGGIHYRWTDDTGAAGKDISISGDSHIYYSDAPGFPEKNVAIYSDIIVMANYVNYFSANIYGSSFQVSKLEDWHAASQIQANNGNPNLLVRGLAANQMLGAGWMDIAVTP
jgi:hypothetical protein